MAQAPGSSFDVDQRRKVGSPNPPKRVEMFEGWNVIREILI